MPVRVEPDLEHPTHHFSLSDGQRKIGLILCDSKGSANPLGVQKVPTPRTALKTTSGTQSYADYEPPWSPMDQVDFTGGRGQFKYEDDVTKFGDSGRMNTLVKKVILGPQETYTTGFRSQCFSLPGSVSWSALITGARKYLAYQFIPTVSFSAVTLSVLMRRVGTPAAAITVELLSDSGTDTPNAVLQTGTITIAAVTDVLSNLQDATITTQALISGTKYWIKVYSIGGTDSDHWEVGVNAASGNTKQSADNASWAVCSVDLYYRVRDTDTAQTCILYQYKYAQYMVTKADAGTGAPKVYINGDRGAADSNAGQLNKLIDATKAWTTNAWAGCVVMVTAGTGSAEETPFRTISSNDGTSCTVSSNWLLAHDTTTEYVIFAANSWTEITGHGMTVPVTDVLVVNDIAYFCQGDAVNIRRHREYNNAGAWTLDWADDGANMAVYMCTVRDSTSGLIIYKANNGSPPSVATAPIVSWPTNLTFAAAITMQDNWGKITGIDEYGDSTKYLYILREGTVYAVNAGKLDEIPLKEMHSVMNYTNGKAHQVHNVYLYFNMLSGLERYYNRVLDDMGPNRDEGLPSERQGNISCMAGYPGKLYAGVDAGTTGISSVLVWNGTGWHELYRAPMAGMRIRRMQFQATPGSALDRLWVNIGGDIIWLAFPSGTLDTTQDASFRYTHEGYVVSSWMHAGMIEISKLFFSLKLFIDSLSVAAQEVYADYQIDTETTWHEVMSVFNTSPTQEVKFALLPVVWKRLRYRLRFRTTDASKTPKLTVTVVDCVSRVPVKHAYAFNFRLVEDDHDLNGDPEDMSVDEKYFLLSEWATELTPVVARTIFRLFDDVVMFIDPPVVKPMLAKEQAKAGYLLSLTMIGIYENVGAGIPV